MQDGHRARLRGQFLENGLLGFTPDKVLELLLFFTHKRCDTNPIARRLIARFGSFSAVLDAPYSVLCEVEGMGPQSACLLKLAAACAAYYANDRVPQGAALSSTRAAGAYLAPKFLGSRNEEVYAVFLDGRQRVLRCLKLFEGTVNAAQVTVKRVVAEAVAANAAGVILAHNHPGGLALPSAEDRRTTEKLAEALQLLDLQLIDHIIVAEDGYLSMADSGMLTPRATAP